MTFQKLNYYKANYLVINDYSVGGLLCLILLIISLSKESAGQ